VINSLGKIIDEVEWQINNRKINGPKYLPLNVFLPTYTIAALVISMKGVDYDQLVEISKISEH
jgi:hypothetical protein